MLKIYSDCIFVCRKMLEYSTDVRFLGVKDIAKMTQSVLEYKMLIRTHHAGIK